MSDKPKKPIVDDKPKKPIVDDKPKKPIVDDKFEYRICLRDCNCVCDCDFDDDCDCVIDCSDKPDLTHEDELDCQTDKSEYISAIKFNISRHGKYDKIIRFEEEVSEKTAILAVEEYLSKPFTKQYFNHVCDDLWEKNPSFDYMRARGYCTRGSLLTDARFLEILENNNGFVKIVTGS